VVQRFLAGESVESLAYDYFMPKAGFWKVEYGIAQVEAILRCYVRKWPKP
jgi:hypothetical protein